MSPTAETSRIAQLHRVDLVGEVVQRLRERDSRRTLGSRPGPSARRNVGFGIWCFPDRRPRGDANAPGEGLVEVSQGKHPRVKPVDAQQLVESLGTFLQRSQRSLLSLTEVRRPLETEIAALAASRATPSHIAALEETVVQMSAAESLNAQIAADMRFHELLALATGNPVFQLLLQALTHLLYQSRQRTIAGAGIHRAVVGHRAILDAVKARAQETSRQAMAEHLLMAEEDLQGETS